MDTFSPPKAPSINGTDVTETPRLISPSFGDGYKQDTPDGLNNAPCALSLTWENLTQAQCTQLTGFFRSHVGQAFLWTLPDETTARKWVTGPWKRAWVAGAVYTLSVSFAERFLP